MAVEVDEERSWAPAVEDDPAARLMGRGSTRSYAQLIIDTANMVRIEEFPYVSGAGACVILSSLDKSTVGHGTGRNQKFQCTISPDFR